MFGELPEIFNKNFAVGFFLPVVTFLIITLALMNGFGTLPTIITIDTTSQSDVLVKTAVFGLVSWLGGVFLLAVNQDLLLFIQGYGRLNPLRLFGKMENDRYDDLQKDIAKLDDKYIEFQLRGEEFPMDLRLKRNRLMHFFAQRFPDAEYGLLPTSFGNIIRAFQVYPQVMYGLDAMPGWERLLAIIPEKYSELINDAKSQVDFWINICSLITVTLVEYLIFIVVMERVSVFMVSSCSYFLYCIFLLKSKKCCSSVGKSS